MGGGGEREGAEEREGWWWWRTEDLLRSLTLFPWHDCVFQNYDG